MPRKTAEAVTTAAPAKRGQRSIEITAPKIDLGVVELQILGTTPLIYNVPSAKMMQQLLLPPGKKTPGEKATTLKHEPYREFVDSTMRRRVNETGPTRLLVPPKWFKGAVSDVAIRLPGVTKAAMEQLVSPIGDSFDLYGIPQIFMAVVRNSDMNRTPDVRTRAIIPEWTCRIKFKYVKPQINAETFMTLMGNAGILNGVGDFRQQKGAGAYGSFEIVAPTDRRVKHLMETIDMATQDEALAEPLPYDSATEDLLNWFAEAMAKRDPETEAEFDGANPPEGLVDGLHQVDEAA